MTTLNDKLNEGHIRLAGAPQGAKLLTTSASPWPVVVLESVHLHILALVAVKVWAMDEQPKGHLDSKCCHT